MHVLPLVVHKMPRLTQASFDARKSINANLVKKDRYIPPGRKRGARNTVQQNVREMFAEFVHNNASQVQVLFDKVAKKDAAKALTIYYNMADFVLPRLARTEVIPSGDPLVSLNPITDAAQAAATYASILGNTKINLNVINFAPPPQAPVVAEQAQILPGPRPDNVLPFERTE